MYTSIVSCNVKKKFCSSSWSGGEVDIISQQPSSERGSPCSEAGAASGLEKLVQLSELRVERCRDIVEVLHPYHSPPHTKFYTLYSQDNLLYYACLRQPPRENCCDIERKYKIQLIDINGEVILIVERPYNCTLDMTSNCWVCGCCACGVVGGSATVKTTITGTVPTTTAVDRRSLQQTTLGSVQHTYSCYTPIYSLQDNEGYELMVMSGGSCGDCLPQYRNSTHEFVIKSEEEVVGSVSRKGNRLYINFNKSLGLKWKLLIMAGGVVVDLMYFGGSESGSRKPEEEEGVVI